MPQLVKRGKYVFGWSRVGGAGRIVIPPEALHEYDLREREKLIVLPGSRTSGGFALGRWERVQGSPLAAAFCLLELAQAPAGAVLEGARRPHCWVELCNGSVTIPPRTLEKYGIGIGDKLLVVRGSGLAVGLLVRGPIVEEATRHAELQVFEL